jgi:hypothetical protein
VPYLGACTITPNCLPLICICNQCVEETKWSCTNTAWIMRVYQSANCPSGWNNMTKACEIDDVWKEGLEWITSIEDEPSNNRTKIVIKYCPRPPTPLQSRTEYIALGERPTQWKYCWKKK